MTTLTRNSVRLFRRDSFFRHTQRYFKCSFSSTSSTHSELPQPRLDYKNISENVTSKSINAINRKALLPSNAISSVARSYVESKRISSELNAKRNARSAVGERIRKSAEAKDNAARDAARSEAAQLKAQVKELEGALDVAEQQCLKWALAIPNDTHPCAPLGPEASAITISTHEPKPIPIDAKRDHVSICKKLDLLDLESGATVTGSSWYFLMNEAALLELALTNYALSVAIRHGFTPVTTPDVVRSDIAVRCGFQPRDDSDPPVSHMYHLASSHRASPELVLSGTSEIPLAGMFANKTFPSSVLPLKVVGIGHAFRAEAGARSADTRGLYRVHQFTKVELFSVTTEDASEGMMEEMKSIQQIILEGLDLPFRVLDMPTEELGASAYRKYDMEAWMPGRGSWGEVSSLSNCTDYQARRLHVRYRPQSSSHDTPTTATTHTKLPFAHTLNGTAAAVPRLIVALLENGAIFDEEGTPMGLRLPAKLKPFWIGGDNGRNIVQWE